MRKSIVRQLTIASIGLGLFSIYIVFLNNFFAVTDLSNLSQTESIILYTQVIRVIVLFGLGLKYVIQPIVPIIVFSIEALLIPPLLILIIFTNSPFYAVAMGAILTAWFGATAITLEPYAIYIYTRSLTLESSIVGSLSLGALELISVLFLSTLLTGVTQPIQGISGLGTQIISQLRVELSGGGGVPNASPGVLSSAGLILVFLGLLFYMALGGYSGTSKLRLPWMLVISLAGTILAFVWIALVSPFQSDILVVLTAPSVAIVLLIWGTTRGK